MFKILKLLLYYFGFQLGFSVLALVISELVIPLDPVEMTSYTMIASTLVMAWILIRFGYVSIAQDRYKAVSMPTWAVSVVFVFSATFVLNVAIEQAGIPNTNEDTFIAMSNNVFGLLSITLLGPILEELLFRGAIEGELLRQGYRPWIAILLSSFIFGVVHLNPAQIPFAFLMGAMFGWLYYRTGSLLPGIVGHILNNSVAAYNMIRYGNATIEEQMSGTKEMWLWTILAVIVFVVATVWLNRDMVDKRIDSSYNKEEK